MRQRDYPTCGYIVPLDRLKPLLTIDKQAEYDEPVADRDYETLGELMLENLPAGLPAFEIYQPADEDTVGDQMEQGELYAVFDEDVLYVRTPTPELDKLHRLGVYPEFACWSVWC